MKRKIAFLLLIIGCYFVHSQPFPDPKIDILHYDFKLFLNETDEIKGEAEITLAFREANIPTIILDLIEQKPGAQKGLKVIQVMHEGKEVRFSHHHEKLFIEMSESVAAGTKWDIKVFYSGIPADGLIISKNMYGRRTYFGDNWPNRARHWLPVIDHPADKATVSFTVVAPAKYQVVANGELEEEISLFNGNESTRWESKVPLPTKVMVIGVAEFAVDHLTEYKGIPISSWVYPQNKDQGFYDYEMALKVLEFMENYIATYPYAKLANVQSTTRYGGMENASNIFYSETSITGKRTFDTETLLAHEIAHQWFGNSASEASWYHVWLSEGFATYFTHLYVEAIYGKERMQVELANDRRLIFYSALSGPVVDTEVNELTDLLNANSYQKGSWILHMLRKEVGDENFQKGIKTYYEKYKFSNALTKDFQEVMEDVSGKKLDTFFQQWLFRPGHPKVLANWEYDAGRKKLTIEIVQQQDGDPFVFPLEIGIKNNSGFSVHPLSVSKQKQSFEIDADSAPVEVRLDPNVWLLFEGSIQKK